MPTQPPAPIRQNDAATLMPIRFPAMRPPSFSLIFHKPVEILRRFVPEPPPMPLYVL